MRIDAVLDHKSIVHGHLHQLAFDSAVPTHDLLAFVLPRHLVEPIYSIHVFCISCHCWGAVQKDLPPILLAAFGSHPLLVLFVVRGVRWRQVVHQPLVLPDSSDHASAVPPIRVAPRHRLRLRLCLVQVLWVADPVRPGSAAQIGAWNGNQHNKHSESIETWINYNGRINDKVSSRGVDLPWSKSLSFTLRKCYLLLYLCIPRFKKG